MSFYGLILFIALFFIMDIALLLRWEVRVNSDRFFYVVGFVAMLNLLLTGAWFHEIHAGYFRMPVSEVHIFLVAAAFAGLLGIVAGILTWTMPVCSFSAKRMPLTQKRLNFVTYYVTICFLLVNMTAFFVSLLPVHGA